MWAGVRCSLSHPSASCRPSHLPAAAAASGATATDTDPLLHWATSRVFWAVRPLLSHLTSGSFLVSSIFHTTPHPLSVVFTVLGWSLYCCWVSEGREVGKTTFFAGFAGSILKPSWTVSCGKFRVSLQVPSEYLSSVLFGFFDFLKKKKVTLLPAHLCLKHV